MPRGYWKINHEDRDEALTDFALGASVAYVQRKLSAKNPDRQVSWNAVKDLYVKLNQQGLIDKRREELTQYIPLTDKYIRIVHLQEKYWEIEQEKPNRLNTPYIKLVRLQMGILRQIAEETGDVSKRGINTRRSFNVPDKPEYPSDKELRRIVQVFSRRFSSIEG